MEHVRKFLNVAKRAFEDSHPTEQMQVQKMQTRYNYVRGPMYFLAQQIIRRMQEAGYPAFVWCHYRSPEQQNKEYAEGDSKARAYHSPHQFMEAVDILHPKLYWGASQDYWDTLAACVKVVEEKFAVALVHGYDWGWDSAHIELKDWRSMRSRVGQSVPTLYQLADRFEEVLPEQWKQFKKSRAFQTIDFASSEMTRISRTYPYKP